MDDEARDFIDGLIEWYRNECDCECEDCELTGHGCQLLGEMMAYIIMGGKIDGLN